MSHDPTAAEIRAFAQLHGLTDDRARRLLLERDHDEGSLSEAAESLKHFFRAPS